MLSIQKMIQSARECLGWPYVSPGSNDENGIDCSGLFVKIYRDQEAKIYHGSNTIFHDYCSQTGKITDSGILVPGMAVFKCKAWTDADQGNKWYGHEPGNLSHIGFVVSSSPLEIIHASSVKGYVTTDTTLGKWAYYGYLKDVDYGTQPSPSPSPEPTPQSVTKYATVYAENGKPVKMRVKPSKNSGLYDELPVGTIVEVLGSKGDWTQVNYNRRYGWWIMTKFLRFDEGGDDPTPIGAVTVTIQGLTEEQADELVQMYPQAKKSYG